MWPLMLTLIVLPIIYSTLSIISIKRRLWLKVWERPEAEEVNKKVSIILPLYNERKEDILLTLRSIERQNYPKHLIEVITVVEKDDSTTKKELASILDLISINVKVLEICGKKGKWYALNKALENCDGEVIVIYDAGDVIESDHLKKAVSLSSKYDIIGSRVYRRSSSLIGLLSYVDTILWYNVLVPAFKEMLGITLVSGEGLALKDKVKFPNCLAEDAFLTLYALKRSLKIGLLDSVIVEGAPTNLESLIKQRIRWYRGFLECFVMTLKENLGLMEKIKLSLVYMSPLTSLSLSIIILLLVLSPLLNPPLWFLILASFTFITLFMAPLFVYIDMNVKDPRVFLSPLHWFLQGFVVLLAFFVKGWFKTIRDYENLGSSSTSISQLPNSDGEGSFPL